VKEETIDRSVVLGNNKPMRKVATKRPTCIIIAGPNGAGKTTFAREYLLKDAGIQHFVNADLIASITRLSILTFFFAPFTLRS
jgi:2-phosphoglycerate kinase